MLDFFWPVIANKARHKIVRNDFEQALLGPKGEGQEARSNLQKSGIRYEIAAVTLFPRNDRI